MNWIVEERFTAQVDSTNMYRIVPSAKSKQMLLHIKVSVNGTSNTFPIGEFDSVSEAVAKAEAHSKDLVAEELPAIEEKVYTSEELIGRK